MTLKWEHPELGNFAFGDSGWHRQVHVPAFLVFTYTRPVTNWETGETRELTFEATEDFDTGDLDESEPSDEAVKLAIDLLHNQESIATKVKNALWDDLNGRGPASGMWWSGALENPAELQSALESGSKIPKSADDLYSLLHLSSISIRQDEESELLIAELMFDCAFEREHGIGILTDGKDITGIGYQLSVEPFEDDVTSTTRH